MDQSIELPTKILVLDSDAQSRRSTVEILRVGADQSGRYELYEAETGESCIRLARQIKPDLILLDILLPDISGLELCRRIKADPGLLGVFIILYSPHKHTLEESTNALETGADSYIVAPASNQELLAQVRAMLRLKRAEDTLRKQSHNLGERVKELKCLYGLSTLVEKADASLHEVLQGVLALIPPAYQYPEITCVRLIVEDQEFRTGNYQESAWQQICKITADGKIVGKLVVGYLMDKPASVEDPFLREEYALVEEIALRLGKTVERFKAKERLLESERKFRGVVEQSQDGISITDEQGIVMEWNHAMETMTGLVAAEVVGQPIWEIQFRLEPEGQKTPQAYERFKAIFQEILKSGQAPWLGRRLERDYDKVDGSTVTVEGEVFSIKTEQGFMLGSISRDITERKHVQRSLETALHQTHQRAEEMNALLEATRAVLSYRDFNEAAQEIFTSCKKLIGAFGGYVALLNEAGDENEMLFLDAGEFPCSVDPNLPMPIRGLRARAYKTAQTVYENAFSSSEWIRYLPSGHLPLEDVLFSPLVIDNQVVGLIGLANKPGGFNDEDARIVTALGDLAALALLNARTLDSLKQSEARLRATFEQVAVGLSNVNLSGKLIQVNQRLCDITGYSQEELLRLTVRDITYPDDLDADLANVQRLLNGEINSYSLEKRFIRKDGSISWVNLTASLVRSASDEPQYFLGVVEDINSRKLAEDKVSASLHEKEALLSEIHHRVKNNLQIISSLLGFQIEYTQDEGVKAVLLENQERVHSLALIHEQLYRSPDLAQIEVKNYLERLLHDLFAAYASEMGKVQIRMEIENIYLEVKKAIPCGLLINELVSNSFKHAFPIAWREKPGFTGLVCVALHPVGENKYLLEVSDNGIGLPQDSQFPNQNSLGMFLIETFTQQLRGKIEWINSGGLTCRVVFSL